MSNGLARRLFSAIFKAGIDEIYVENLQHKHQSIEIFRWRQVLEILLKESLPGEKALEIGLVDEIGTLHDAIAYAA